ncbi:MAG: type II secretion system protein [Gammaproteobacteria bacterium]|nr:type II secretion system protein [Gammaproteobacteria bacterium]
MFKTRIKSRNFPQKTKKRQGGFSLIELVAVIVILGVLATATVQYINFGTEIYVNANLRQQKLSESRFLIERLTREIRGAIPNSIRTITNGVTQSCIEFVPIKASGAYRNDADSEVPPISPNAADDVIDVVSWSNNVYEQNDRMYIYATDIDEIYGNPVQVQIIDSVTDNGDPQYQIGFSANVQFPQESPINRYFTADRSVVYCLINNSSSNTRDVYRFEFSDFATTRTLPLLASAGVLMAEGVTNDLTAEPPFDYEPGVLTQNSVVSLYLEFEADAGENMFYNHEVHIPNVP